MSFWSTLTRWLAPGAPAPASEPEPAPVPDIQKTYAVAELLQVARERRDDAWMPALLDLAPDASFAALTPQVRPGPDGFPYFALVLPSAGAFTPYSIRMLLPHLLTQGVGVTLGAESSQADWVFRHGDIVSFAVTGAFLRPPPEGDVGPLHGVPLLVASPHERFLPGPTRAVLRRLLSSHGVVTPKVALLSVPAAEGVRQVLALTLPDGATGVEVERMVGWCLPRHYRFAPLPPELARSAEEL